MATIKPAAPPTWATDATFSSGPKAGSPTKIEPSAGAKAQGDVPNQPYRAERKNWLLGKLCDYAAYLHGLATDDAFLGAVYAWTNAHTFSGNTTLAGTTVSAGEIPLTTPISRVKRITLADFQNVIIPGTSAVWYQTEAGGWVVDGDSAMIRKPLHLPAGSIVTRVRAGYKAVNLDANIALVRMTPDVTVPLAAPTRSILWQTLTGVGGPGDVLVDSGTISHAADDNSELCIEVTSSLTPWGAGPQEALVSLELTYTQVRVGERV